jgi:hypothetical protein
MQKTTRFFRPPSRPLVVCDRERGDNKGQQMIGDFREQSGKLPSSALPQIDIDNVMPRRRP